MAFVPVIATAQVEVRGNLMGEPVENVLYFRYPSPEPPVAALTQLGTDVANWAQNVICEYVSADYTLREIYVTSLDSDTAPAITVPVSPPFPGQVEENAMPGNVTVTLSFRTIGRGRSSRGRNYVPAIPRSVVTGNTVSTAFLENLRAGYALMINTTFAQDWEWVVVSRQQEGVVLPFGIPIPVTAVVFADNDLDSQRRRLKGRGASA